MDLEIRKRLRCIQLYKRLGNAGFACLKCGISRPTLRKLLKSYEPDGNDGLKTVSRRLHTSPAIKVTSELEKLTLETRKTRKLGHRRLCNEIKRRHDVLLSVATIHKVHRKNDEPYLHIKKKDPSLQPTRSRRSCPNGCL